VFVHRNTATVVNNPNGAIGLHVDLNVIAVARQGFVNRVVDNLVDQVMQAPRARGADVHAGALSNGLETLENLNVAGSVFAL
jgi:hypothetical protein